MFFLIGVMENDWSSTGNLGVAGELCNDDYAVGGVTVAPCDGNAASFSLRGYCVEVKWSTTSQSALSVPPRPVPPSECAAFLFLCPAFLGGPPGRVRWCALSRALGVVGT